MSKKDNLKDYLADLYEGIASRKPNASKNPQDFRSEIEGIGFVLEATSEEKTVTPTKEKQEVKPSSADFLSKVTVEPIPSIYVIPNGETPITKNGRHDVAGKAVAVVDVKPKLMEKVIETNGTYRASNDGVEGYARVIVRTSGGESNLTGALSLGHAVGIESTKNPTEASPTIAHINGEIFILTEV